MIGIIIHGPEPVDTGFFQSIYEDIEDSGRIVMAGTTGASAVIDSGLESRIEILTHKLVSSAVTELSHNHELVLIVNNGKTREGSLRLASVVAQRSCPCACPVVLMDVDFHTVLNPGEEGLWKPIVERFCPEEVQLPGNIDSKVRMIHGVLPGESIWVNGNVIGKALSRSPRIWMGDDGKLVFEGIDIRNSAYDHVGDFDHLSAKIRSGKVRRTTATPRSIPQKGNAAILVDHDAEECLRMRQGVRVAVTVGDDTTRIAGSLLYRFSIPVIGIVDGDEDGICDENLHYPGSKLFILRPGSDDVVGNMIAERYFDNGRRNEVCDPVELEEGVRALCAPYLVKELSVELDKLNNL